MATVVLVILMLALSFACLLSLVFMGYSSYLIYVHWMYSHIPGPKRDNFFSGNYPLLQREGKRGKILHEVVEDLRVNYGPVMVIWIYHRPIVFVSDPEVARKCLVTLNLPKNSFGAKNFAFPYGQRFVGNGLVTELDHEVWQKRRSLLNPAFHRRYLMNLMTAFNSSCDLFLNNLDEMADGKTVVDMAEEFARVTMDVIGKVCAKDVIVLHLLLPTNHYVTSDITAFSTLANTLCTYQWPRGGVTPGNPGYLHDNVSYRMGKENAIESLTKTLSFLSLSILKRVV